MIRFFLYWLCFSIIGGASILHAQALFDSDERITFTLEADIEALQNDRGSKPSYHPATLTYQEGDSKVQLQIEIRARGRFRRDPYICEFPPLHYRFPKDSSIVSTLFEGQRKIKVVTHCREDQFIYREYYLYRVYNMLTDTSFRVRLAEITYVDSKGNVPTITRPGFFIESEKAMARRNGGKPVNEDIVLKPDDVDRSALTLMHVFNYMIANRDFGVEVRQNLKVITNGDEQPITVPYDFDWAGIVDASYTQTPGTKKAPVYYQRRRFKPLCRSREEFGATFDQFLAIKDQLFLMYQESPYLTDDQKKETLKYYKNFYKNIRKEKVIQEVFVNSCNS